MSAGALGLFLFLEQQSLRVDFTGLVLSLIEVGERRWESRLIGRDGSDTHRDVAGHRIQQILGLLSFHLHLVHLSLQLLVVNVPSLLLHVYTNLLHQLNFIHLFAIDSSLEHQFEFVGHSREENDKLPRYAC